MHINRLESEWDGKEIDQGVDTGSIYFLNFHKKIIKGKKFSPLAYQSDIPQLSQT